MMSLVESKKNVTDELIYKTETDSMTKKANLQLPKGKGDGEGINRELGMERYTHLCLRWITNKDLLCSAWNSAQCYVAAWMGREFGGEWIRVYIYG